MSSGSQIHLSTLPGEHGKACLPVLLNKPFRFFSRSTASKATSPNATSSRTRFTPSNRAIPRLKAPFTPLSRKPGSSSSSFYISSPICTTPTKDLGPQALHVRSPSTKQLPRLPSRFSEYTFMSEVVTRAGHVPVEPSNASSELLNASSDCLVAEANKLLPEFTKELTLTVPSKRRRRKVPPALVVDDWELVDGVRDEPQRSEEGSVLSSSVHTGVAHEKAIETAAGSFALAREPGSESTVSSMHSSPKVMVFGTNAALPDDIDCAHRQLVQAFIRTQVVRRRRARRRSRKSLAAGPLGDLAMTKGHNSSANGDEDEMISPGSLSPPTPSSGHRSEDTPTYATTPALSSADTVSIYSCSSAAFSTTDDVTVAVSSPNESDLDGKSFEVIVERAQQQMETLNTVRPARQLIARSFPSGLSISIPLKAPPNSAPAGRSSFIKRPTIPAITPELGCSTTRLPHLDEVEDASDSRCFTAPSCEDMSLAGIATVDKERQNRRQGTLYGKDEPRIPFPTRCDDTSSSHLGVKPELSTCPPSGDESGRAQAGISYRSEHKPGLRPLLLPRLLPQYNDERTSRSLRSPCSFESLPPLTPKDSLTLTPISPCSEQATFSKVSGDPVIEWSPASPTSLTDANNDGFTILRPEHIKLRRSKSSIRLLVAPGPAF
ncbi:hypothetical protein CVT26_013773 [Gymnopilus dilepis]|uniref:Uncharacterized protein n=1 Tax=Gymnopilus dilepis TaxID=231916 RepID=A0A409Y6F5_9AGAR|nr:hypothetical protein CVT26_013773 [Gymnopilus dilepis]